MISLSYYPNQFSVVFRLVVTDPSYIILQTVKFNKNFDVLSEILHYNDSPFMLLQEKRNVNTMNTHIDKPFRLYFTKQKHWRSHENTNIRQPTQTIQITDVQDLEKILLRNWFPTRTETRCGLPWQHKLISQRSITDDTNDGQLSNYHNNIFILNFVVIIIIKTNTIFIVHLDKQFNVMFTDRVEPQSQ